MRIKQDRRFLREAVVDLVLTAVGFGVGWFFNSACAYSLLICGGLFTVVHLIFTLRRMREIARLSDSLDRILHGADVLLPGQYTEGELPILHSEIEKILLRLRENNARLNSDKILLSQSIADISHQLRTPLTSVNLMLSLLRSEPDPAERIRLMRELSRSLQRIDWLIETLLKLSRIDAGAVSFASDPVSVRQLIRRAAESLQVNMELRGVSFDVSCGDETYRGDADWSVEALANLIKNCMEHTPPGGTVSVSAEQTPLYTRILVRDTGPGFDPDDLPHLFERFYRGKDASENSVGIGLSLARSAIAAQNGTLTAYNGKEGGACFEIRFYFGPV